MIGTSNSDKPRIIIGESINRESALDGLAINIEECVKSHKSLSYTTCLESTRLIFHNKTLRSSSLNYAKLNDPIEKERVGVTEFAGSRFITCFTQIEHESVPFWIYYGGEKRSEKILLQFRNFTNCFLDCFHLDYALHFETKCMFYSEKDSNTITSLFSSSENDRELGVFIDSVNVFDIEYVPLDSPVFNVDNSGKTIVDLSKFPVFSKQMTEMKAYDSSVLGKQKSDPWDYERETRILCTLFKPDFSKWDHIDLRLKDEMFRGLKVVLSPWDTTDWLRQEIRGIIDSADLPKEIKESISVEDSGLKGKLCFPE